RGRPSIARAVAVVAVVAGAAAIAHRLRPRGPPSHRAQVAMAAAAARAAGPAPLPVRTWCGAWAGEPTLDGRGPRAIGCQALAVLAFGAPVTHALRDYAVRQAVAAARGLTRAPTVS